MAGEAGAKYSPRFSRNWSLGRQAFYLSEPEPDERRIDVYATEAGDYLFEMGPSADGPVVGKLLSSPDFGREVVGGRSEIFRILHQPP